MEALSQIICVFGSEELKNAAKSYGKMMLLECFITSCCKGNVADVKSICSCLM